MKGIIENIYIGGLSLAVIAFPIFMVAMALAGHNALGKYNADRRQQSLAELPSGYFSMQQSLQTLLFHRLPPGVSSSVQRHVWTYRIRTSLFFANLMIIFLLFYLRYRP